MRLRAVALASLLLLFGCRASRPSEVLFEREVVMDEPWLSNPDYGDLEHFNGCRATSRRRLTESERCYIAALSARCTEQDDCHVSCWNSPDGMSVGGGCFHLCGLLDPKPPGWSACEALEESGK